jgi:hypothetical protein
MKSWNKSLQANYGTPSIELVSGKGAKVIDVDGNELDVLCSAKKFLLKNSPYIIMEFSPSALKAKGVLVKNFYKFIKILNYSIYDFDLKKITNHILVSNNSSIDILLMKNNSI